MILFSQTREDPQIELNALNNTPQNILMIGSGGDTVLAILTKHTTIDVIDTSIGQLNLIQLKQYLLTHFNNTADYINFITSSQDVTPSNPLINNLPLNIKQYWLNHLDEINSGINQSGIFEQLFRDLVKNNFDFKNIFEKEYLTSLFGKDATAHSKNDFAKHFHNVLKTYQTLYTPSANYFYHQILNDSYHPTNPPPYTKNTENITKYHNQITYHQTDIITYLSTHQHQHKYHIIQISNILDWSTHQQKVTTISLIHKHLHPNGLLIVRRLNGDYKLSNYITPKYFTLHDNTTIDKSHFYSEVATFKKVDIPE